ncbi:hypothetical protein [Microbulbifer sp. HZ11]|uniref:hypothetical protein n=1 Tax=unclassified Microbulbifer TaxID=2619833 RepID=UPI0005BAD52C|nr:hypothetical protein [Microbulbifer sp. HZ11]
MSSRIGEKIGDMGVKTGSSLEQNFFAIICDSLSEKGEKFWWRREKGGVSGKMYDRGQGLAY